MERTYLDEKNTHFTRTGLTFVSVLCPDGSTVDKVEPRRLFPFSYPEKYISLLNPDGEEIGILRDLDGLDAEDRNTITECLEEYYFIPKIIKVNSVEEKFGVIRFYAVTDKGLCQVNISSTIDQFRMMSKTRLLIRDNNYNRYEVPDISALDPTSSRLVRMYL